MIVGFFPATAMPDADWWQALWPDPAKPLADMGVAAGMVAVDLCCGDGRFTVPLVRIAKRVYAIDIDPAVLDRARARVAEARAANCEFAVANAMDVDAVVPEPVDYVFLANESFPDLARLSWPGLNAVIGGLKPGDLTLNLFQRLPAELLGQSTWLLGAEGSFAEKT
jgi:SAM-dependent methyltransferase